jgi:hypothetical protein
MLSDSYLFEDLLYFHGVGGWSGRESDRILYFVLRSEKVSDLFEVSDQLNL